MKRQQFFELKNLKKLIKKKNKSYVVLAHQLGISADSLNNKLNGYYQFKSNEIFRLCGILEIEYSDVWYYFFDGRGKIEVV